MIFTCLVSKAQNIPYYTPKKVFEITIPYTIKTVQKVKKSDKSKVGPPSVSVTIKDPIVVQGKMIQNDLQFIDLSPLGQNGRTFNFNIGYDIDGYGFLSSLNGTQEPVTGEIIKGVASVTGVVLKAFSGIPLGVAGGTKVDDTEDETTEEKAEEKNLIDLPAPGSYETTVVPTLKTAVGAPPAQIPKVIIKFEPIVVNPPTDFAKRSNDNSVGQLFIPIKLPVQYRLQVFITDNPGSRLIKHTFIDQIVHVPQFGNLVNIPIPILKGKKTVEVTLSPVTGFVTKYNVIKTSTTKDLLADSKTSIEDIGKVVQQIRDKNIKDKEDKELTTNRNIQAEIDLLKLENDKLDLLLKKAELEKQAEEAAKAAAEKIKNKG